MAADNEILVEDFVEFDRNELSFPKLIFRHYEPWWKVLSLGLTTMGIALVGVALLIKLYVWLAIMLFVVGCGLAFIGIKYSHTRTRKVMREHYPNILKKHERWDYKTIARIRVEKMKEHFGNQIAFRRLQTVLVAVQRKSLAPQYKFFSGQLLWSVVTLFAAAYIAALLQLPDEKQTTLNHINNFFRIFAGIGLLLIGTIFCFELMVVRELWQWNTNKYERLIRTLENYILTLQKK
jgi:hypothetical protein